MENRKLDADECVKKWASEIRADRTMQYLKSTRRDHLKDLMSYFIAHDVAQDDAQFTKNAVVKILVSPTGMMGTKKEHRNWKENAENDFDDIVQEFFVVGLKDSGFEQIKTAQGYDPRIVDWAKAKFGNHVGQNMIIAAHQPLHVLWAMYMEDRWPDKFKQKTGGF